MTTSDPATLREALRRIDLARPFAPEIVGLHLTDLGTFVAAARWALDLTEGGKEVWWCEYQKEVPESNHECLRFPYHKGCGKRLLVAL